MKLFLVKGYTKPKAQLDPIFRLKETMTFFCEVLADYRQWDAWAVPRIKNKIRTEIIEYQVRKHYYDMTQVMDFDNLLYKELRRYAPEMQEDCYLLEFNKEVLDIANNIPIRPNLLSAPLYYNEGKIDTLYKGKFWGKFDRDVYRHETMVIRTQGEDLFFAHLQEKIRPFPIWTIPYLSVKDIDKQFARHKTTHREMYQVMKGLFNLWFGFKF
jgi:hypothetical protein